MALETVREYMKPNDIERMLFELLTEKSGSGVEDVPGGVTPAEYKDQVMRSVSGQTGSVDDAIRQAIASGTQSIRDEYSPAYEQLISEQAQSGRLRSPVSLASTGRLRAEQNKAISNLIGSLMQKGAEMKYGAYSSIPENILKGYSTFGGLGLQGKQLGQRERETLAEKVGGLATERRLAAENERRQKPYWEKEIGLKEASLASQGAQDLARQEEEHSIMGQVGKGFGMVGNTGQFIGGLGSLIKGIKS